MTENTHSQTQQMKDAWTRALEDGAVRMSAAMDEAAKLEAKGFEQASQAIDELAKVQKDSLVYLAKLGAEWRKLAVEATKRTADLFAARS